MEDQTFEDQGQLATRATGLWVVQGGPLPGRTTTCRHVDQGIEQRQIELTAKSVGSTGSTSTTGIYIIYNSSVSKGNGRIDLLPVDGVGTSS